MVLIERHFLFCSWVDKKGLLGQSQDGKFSAYLLVEIIIIIVNIIMVIMQGWLYEQIQGGRFNAYCGASFIADNLRVLGFG